MIQHAESHVDHVPADVLALVLDKFKDKTEFFIETFELPEGVTVECGLYGPVMGDAPVSEAVYEIRSGRKWHSRLVDRPMRQTKLCTVIGGPYADNQCVLFTVFGGPAAPKETGDTTIKSVPEYDDSMIFWASHALARG